MFKLLQEAHTARERLRALLTEAQAASETGERHVAALVAAANEEEKALYDKWVADLAKPPLKA